MLHDYDPTRHELMNVTKVKYVAVVVVIIKVEGHHEFVTVPFVRAEEDGFVVVYTKIACPCLAEELPVLVVSRSGTGKRLGAIGTCLRNARFELIQVGVGSIRKVSKAEGMVKVASIRLNEVIVHTDFHGYGGIYTIPAFPEFKITELARVQIHFDGERAVGGEAHG